jgi:hypothetical protein
MKEGKNLLLFFGVIYTLSLIGLFVSIVIGLWADWVLCWKIFFTCLALLVLSGILYKLTKIAARQLQEERQETRVSAAEGGDDDKLPY